MLPLRNVTLGHSATVMQRPIERGNQVVGLLETNREPDQPIEATATKVWLRREIFRDGLVMIDFGRDPVKRQCITDDDACCQDIGKMPRLLLVCAGNTKREQRTVPHIMLCDRDCIRMRWQRRMKHVRHSWMRRQKCGDSGCRHTAACMRALRLVQTGKD